MWRRMLPACLTVGLTATALSVPIGATPVAAACNDVAATEAAAVSMAATCGEPVAVDRLRNEYSQVIAQPDGRMTFESSVVPERVWRGTGWVDVNLELAPGSDGLLHPAASVADVAFSNGGTDPLVTLHRGGRTMTMSWPGVLPAPTIDKNAAKYAEVLSGVDLIVRATETGFTHVLVVKSAAAATLSAVREIRFDLGGDATIEAADGALQAVGSGSVLASTEPAMMWDSRSIAPVASKTTRSTLQPAAASPSTPEAASDAARIAPVEVSLAGGDLVLRPDAKLLQGASFPLYIDPQWSVFKQKWAYATGNGSNNTDYSTARVGWNPDTKTLYRSFFQFSTTASNGVSLSGKQILSARVEMELDHSWDCDKTVASMHWSSAIDATMRATWSKMSLLRYLDSATGRANEAGGCGVIQGDQDMIFQGSAVTALVQSAAKDKWANLTVGFTARDADGAGESTQSRWKKFLPNKAKLVADYNSTPTAPTELYAATVKCGSGVVSVGTYTPTFSAKFNDADGTGDSLTGVFDWIEVPAAGMGAVTDNSPTRQTPPPNKTNVTAGASATSATVTTVRGKKYAFRARTIDKHKQKGPWSGWCQFAVDTGVPPVSGTIVSNASAPGKKIRVRIESTASDVTKFRYGWDDATKEVAASTTTPKFAEVEVTAQRLGTNSLKLKAIDATLNEGRAELPIPILGQPIAPVARWDLETYPGTSSPTSALADRVPAPTDSWLTATNVTWADDVHLIGGQTATFNGTSSAATTSAAVVNTTGAFGVAAWVQLGAVPGNDVKVAVQEGTDASGFELGVRRIGTALTPHWSFLMKDTSAQSSTTVAALAPSALTAADVGRWTHIAGSFDPVEKKIRLFVDGVKVAEVDRTAAPWSATGRFVVGRGFAGGAVGGFWKGSIADVQVFDRVLVGDDFTGRRAFAEDDSGGNGFEEPGTLAPVQVGSWDFNSAVDCRRADLRDTCEAPDLRTAWSRWLALSRGADIQESGDRRLEKPALWLDEQFFAADDGTVPDEVTSEYGRSAAKNGTTPPDDDGREFTLWQEQQVLRTDQSFTVSAWAMPSADMTGSRTVVAQRGTHESAFGLRYDADHGKWVFTVGSQDVPTAAGATMTDLTSTAAAVAGVWNHLTAVYDAGAKQTRLYVNGEPAGVATVTESPFNAAGAMLVGQTFRHGALTDQWHGGIDDIAVFQGAMNDAAVSLMYEHQNADSGAANELHQPKTLEAGHALRAGSYELRMQTDGNLVLYRQGVAIWSPNTWGHSGAYTAMQGDGNLVIYDKNKVPLWHSNTYRSAADRLVLFDDGRLELHDAVGRVVWKRPTAF
jgi:hypothetical protein